MLAYLYTLINACPIIRHPGRPAAPAIVPVPGIGVFSMRRPADFHKVFQLDFG